MENNDNEVVLVPVTLQRKLFNIKRTVHQMRPRTVELRRLVEEIRAKDNEVNAMHEEKQRELEERGRANAEERTRFIERINRALIDMKLHDAQDRPAKKKTPTNG